MGPSGDLERSIRSNFNLISSYSVLFTIVYKRVRGRQPLDNLLVDYPNRNTVQLPSLHFLGPQPSQHQEHGPSGISPGRSF